MLARLLLLLAVVFMPAVALAHAQLQTASPQEASIVAEMPAELMLVFNEPVSPLRLVWISPDGRQTEVAARAHDNRLALDVPPAMRDQAGTHLVSWRVVSSDGHPVSGTLSFSLGSPSAPPTAAAQAAPGGSTAVVLARAALTLTLAFGVAVLFGAALFSQSRSRSAMVAAWLTFPAGLGLIAAHGLDLNGGPLAALADPALWRTALSTPLALTAGLAMAAAALALASGPSLAGAMLALALAGGSFALSGHAAGAAPVALMAPAMALHATCALFWAGTLPVLFVRAGARTLTAGELARYSRLALPLVSALLVTGLVLAAVQLGSPERIFGSAYGALLGIKLMLVSGLLVLALYNRFRLTPRLAAATTPDAGTGAGRVARRTIGSEILIIAVILVLVAGFRLTPPPRALAPTTPVEVSLHLHGQAAMADVRVTRQDDGRVGLSVVLMDGDGAPLAPKDLTGSLSNPSAGLAGLRLALTRQSDGLYVSEPMSLPLAAGWVLQLDVLITDFQLQKLSEPLPALP
ncbi:CopD family protein [Pannonibacter tanglangensis]|uniref:Copper resistance protein CopC n=1 Tax=Pannonibacter tanglangensis TaxID=2750084 RepID=A0ABW9ZM53_9HYPH|nr:CopD family protein [Pannonibacter sp. XCT-34]NBN65128.1 copper resistance protein CopC [Pannonibacter sp. XCT-34]